MKNFKKLGAVFLALAMVVTLLVPLGKVSAEEKYDLVIHKILMDDATFDAFDSNAEGKYGKGTKGKDGTDYTGAKINNIESFFAKNGTLGADNKFVEEIAGVAFDIYKEVPSTTQGEKVLNSNDPILGGLGENDKKYQFVRTVTTEANGATATGLDKGTYIIVENKKDSTYKGKEGQVLAKSKAIPVKVKLPQAKVDGSGGEFTTGDNALHIYPKNTSNKPEIDKNFKDTNGLTAEAGTKIDNQINLNDSTRDKGIAVAEIGKVIPYQVETKLPKDTFYKALVWTDTMDAGLTFMKDAQGTTNGVNLEFTGIDNVPSSYYTVTASESGFKLEFTEAGIKAINEQLKKNEIKVKLTYSAKVNGRGIVEHPNQNNIEFSYNNNPTGPVEVTPSNGSLTVTKDWAKPTENANVPVKYVLFDGDKVVATVYFDANGAYQSEKSVLTEGIEFEQDKTNKYSGTFKKLKESGATYKIREFVNGFSQAITPGQDGSVAIKNTKDNTVIKPSSPSVVFYGKKFVKMPDGDTTGKRLAGAKFKIYKTEKDGDKFLVVKSAEKKIQEEEAVSTAKKQLDSVIANYNKTEESAKTQEDKNEVNAAQEAYNKAVIAARTAYEWGAEADALEVVSDAEGRFEITGLEAGTYYLKETKAPDGYGLLQGGKEFTVAKGTYTQSNTAENHVPYNPNKQDGEDTSKGYGLRVDNKKVTIPQTGGIGTLIFAVVGIGLMGLAAYAMRRNSKEQ